MEYREEFLQVVSVKKEVVTLSDDKETHSWSTSSTKHKYTIQHVFTFFPKDLYFHINLHKFNLLILWGDKINTLISFLIKEVTNASCDGYRYSILCENSDSLFLLITKGFTWRISPLLIETHKDSKNFQVFEFFYYELQVVLQL